MLPKFRHLFQEIRPDACTCRQFIDSLSPRAKFKIFDIECKRRLEWWWWPVERKKISTRIKSYRRLELCCSFFSRISHFLERILMEHIDIKRSLDSKLQIYFVCFIRISTRKCYIVEKPEQHNSKPPASEATFPFQLISFVIAAADCDYAICSLIDWIPFFSILFFSLDKKTGYDTRATVL